MLLGDAPVESGRRPVPVDIEVLIPVEGDIRVPLGARVPGRRERRVVQRIPQFEKGVGLQGDNALGNRHLCQAVAGGKRGVTDHGNGRRNTGICGYNLFAEYFFSWPKQ